MEKVLRVALSLSLIFATIAVCTFISYLLSPWLTSGRLDLIYLIGVLLVAMTLGLWPSLVCSALSYLAYSYYFEPPLHSFVIANAQGWLDLIAFGLAAVITGTLTATVRRQLQQIRESAEHTHQLYDFTRGIARAITRNDLAALVCEHVSSTLNCQTRVLFVDDQGGLKMSEDQPFSAADMDTALNCLRSMQVLNRADGWTFVPLSSGNQKPVGVMAMRPNSSRSKLNRTRLRILLAMRNQAVIALDRIDLAAHLEHSQLLRETERLREALLSSVSHDLRTPLASIIGAATTLRDLDGELAPAQRRDLLSTVIDEASRLNRFVQNLLDMTRIGYGALKPRFAWIDLREIIGPALRSLAAAHPGHRVQIVGDEDLPSVWTDAVLFERVLFNVLDNAAKYAPAAEPITLRLSREENTISLTISDRGPGIPADQREKVFDMFHRVQRGDSTAAGTGMGLAICRGLMQALGGSITADSGADGHGTSMILKLSIQPATK